MQGLYTIQDYPNPLILYFVLLPYLCISQGNHILIPSLNVISFLKYHSELCPPSSQHNLFFSLSIQNIVSFLRCSKHSVLHYEDQNIRCCIMHIRVLPLPEPSLYTTEHLQCLSQATAIENNYSVIPWLLIFLL